MRRQRKAKPTAAASERGFGKYGRSIAGDVESPSLLPLLLLLLMLLLPYEVKAISAAPYPVGGARRRCDTLVWVTSVVSQTGYVVASYLVRVVHKVQFNLSS